MTTAPHRPAPTPSDATPRSLTGVWQRRSLSIDGGPAHEVATVLWLQVGRHYLDIRATDRPGLLSGPGVFAGTTTWRAPSLTWHHHLDSAHVERGGSGPATDEIAADTAVLTLSGGTVVERGSFTQAGRTISYVEVWRRLAGPGDIAVATAHGSYATPGGAGRAVRIGDHRAAITVDPGRGAWAGVVERLTAGVWELVVQVGDHRLVPPLLAHRDEPHLPVDPHLAAAP